MRPERAQRLAKDFEENSHVVLLGYSTMQGYDVEIG
jgi:hypothetical protein